jgi:para-nitrobenzyl esterase
MRRRWLDFAVDGDPSAGGPVWRPYRQGDHSTLVIDKEDRLVTDLDEHLRSAWGDQVLNFR